MGGERESGREGVEGRVGRERGREILIQHTHMYLRVKASELPAVLF